MRQTRAQATTGGLRQLVLLTLVLAGACRSPAPPPAVPQSPPPAKRSAPDAERQVRWQTAAGPLGIRLSDAPVKQTTRARPAQVEFLSTEEAARILSNLPSLGQPKRAKFALPESSLPAPRPGRTVKTEFPPRQQPKQRAPHRSAQTKAQPLQVVRHSPVGPVALAPLLSVTFSHSMLPLSSYSAQLQQQLPVRLSPEPVGAWRWVGTRTVLFQPQGRFPMATEYQVRVPAGTSAITGQRLSAEASWTFSTPPPTVIGWHPFVNQTHIGLEPTLFIGFDQRIDQRALLPYLQLRARGKTVELRLARTKEIVEAPQVRLLAQSSQPAQWIALRAKDKLPKDSEITLTVKQEAPSAEGPRRTDRDQQTKFHTYAPLAVEKLTCGWRGNCPPGAPWVLAVNNDLDLESFDPALVTVTPPVEELQINAGGRAISIQAQASGRRRYTVSVAAELRDVFGQTLGKQVRRTIDVDSSPPRVFWDYASMLVLDPALPAALTVYSVNQPSLRQRLYRVTPQDWEAYLKRYGRLHRSDPGVVPPGTLVERRNLVPAGKPDELVATQVELSKHLADGLGHLVLVIDASRARDHRRGRPDRLVTWIQSTRLGLHAFTDHTHAQLWVTELESGAPIRGAQVGPLGATRARTDARGLGRFALPSQAASVLLARRANDVAFLPGGGSLRRHVPDDDLRWFVLDDGGLYRPGESVHVKGWVRQIGLGKGGDVGRLRHWARSTVSFRTTGPRGNEIAKGETRLDEHGGFHLSFQLPTNINLGDARLLLQLEQSIPIAKARPYLHRFQIEEFKRPEYEINLSLSDGPHLVGAHCLAMVKATYYTGGGLPDSPTRWKVSTSTAHYSPPNWSDYQFGQPRWQPWSLRKSQPSPDPVQWKARTDLQGRHRLRLDFDATDPPYPRQVQLEAAVRDANYQEWSAQQQLLVHPAAVYVGAKPVRRLVRAGSEIPVELVVTDLDGSAIAGRRVIVKSARLDWKGHGAKRQRVHLDTQTCEFESGSKPHRCLLPTRQGGLHEVTAVVVDAAGRRNQTQLSAWVDAPDARPLPGPKQHQVHLLADRSEYRAGETAELMLVSPFAPAEGVLTLRRQGLVHLERFTLQKRTQSIRVKVDPDYLPNVTAQVDLVGATARLDSRGEPDPALPKRPAHAGGSVELRVPPLHRTLQVSVEPRPRQVKPGGKVDIQLQVSDPKGQPARDVQLALVVVDEALLALAGYELPDPIRVFYSNTRAGVGDLESRLSLALLPPELRRPAATAPGKISLTRVEESDTVYPALGGRPRRLTSASSMHSGGRAVPAQQSPKRNPQRLRKDLSALAAFVPDLTTNVKGQARARVELPESITRYRVIAVAATRSKEFGRAESTVTARLPLMVRPAPPRFLNYGDRFSLSVLVQNPSPEPLEVDVAARAANALLLGPAGQRVVVAGGDRVQLQLPAAASLPGKARFQVGAASAAGGDAAEFELPVWTPATTEAFATYGELDEGSMAQPIQVPQQVVEAFGGLEVTTSSTALAGLSDALLYLARSKYEHNEFLASRILGVAALRHVLEAFGAEDLPSPQELSHTVQQDIQVLLQRERHGQWSYFESDARPSPYITVHVVHALVRAKQQGFAIPPGRLDYVLRRLTNLPLSRYSKQTERAIRAYATYVRHLGGKREAVREARALLTKSGSVEQVPLEGLGWLLPVLSTDPASLGWRRQIQRHLGNRVTETAAHAHFVSSYGDQGFVLLHSARRADAVILDALITDSPKSDLIPKLAKGLLAHRTRGRWLNTQENVFVLLALGHYFDAYERQTPDYVARSFIGDRYAAGHEFRKRTTDRQLVEIPMGFLQKLGRRRTELVLAKEGPGRLYYRLGLRYAPSSLRPAPAEHGLAVTRAYEPIDDPQDVKKVGADLWRVRRGARVRTRVYMLAPARRYHVALVDPLPAGFEPINTQLAITPSLPGQPDLAAGVVRLLRGANVSGLLGPGASAGPLAQGMQQMLQRPEVAARAPGLVPLAQSLALMAHSRWYQHHNLRDDRAEAFTTLLPAGLYVLSYVSRATTAGEFVVPPPKAEEMYHPETFGRGAATRLVVY